MTLKTGRGRPLPSLCLKPDHDPDPPSQKETGLDHLEGAEVVMAVVSADTQVPLLGMSDEMLQVERWLRRQITSMNC